MAAAGHFIFIIAGLGALDDVGRVGPRRGVPRDEALQLEWCRAPRPELRAGEGGMCDQRQHARDDVHHSGIDAAEATRSRTAAQAGGKAACGHLLLMPFATKQLRISRLWSVVGRLRFLLRLRGTHQAAAAYAH